VFAELLNIPVKERFAFGSVGSVDWLSSAPADDLEVGAAEAGPPNVNPPPTVEGAGFDGAGVAVDAASEDAPKLNPELPVVVV
jgi:hypothetical protein